jgi:hypothetical protein
MQPSASSTVRAGQRAFFGIFAYWAVNLGLVLAEARWHVLYHLTAWDVAALRTIALAAVHHPH